MKTYVIYRDNSDHSRVVTDFLRDFERQTGKKLQIVDPDSREGAEICQTYDIMEFPTLLAVDYSGAMQQIWRGLPLPRIGEVSYYVHED